MLVYSFSSSVESRRVIWNSNSDLYIVYRRASFLSIHCDVDYGLMIYAIRREYGMPCAPLTIP